jgi:PleD family two-component response regulator
MKDITVNKQKLIEVLEKNKKEHIKEYDLAMIGYKINVVKEYKSQLRKFRKLSDEEVKNFSLGLNTSLPTSHEDDFDLVIGMLNASVDDTLEITENQYREYYLNQWGWYSRWTLSNSGNVGIGTSSPEGQLYLSNHQ